MSADPKHPDSAEWLPTTGVLKEWLYNSASIGLVTIGIIVGIWHGFIGLRGLWVFREHEPLSSWIVILTGPLSMLPATLLAVFRRPWGASWLIGGGLLSLGGVVLTEVNNGETAMEVTSAALSYSRAIALPMFLVGVGLILLHRRAAARPPTSHES